jgi:EF-hand domain pair
LADAFDRIDSDGTGYITAENLAEMLGGDFPRDELHAIIAESDISNDGRVSYEAFLRLWEEPDGEHNHYSIFREIMLDGKTDSERSANVSGISESGMSSDESPLDAPRLAYPKNSGDVKKCVERAMSSDGKNKRVMFSDS